MVIGIIQMGRSLWCPNGTEMAYIKTILPEDAVGKLAKEYSASIKRAGKVYGIVALHSLDPELLRGSMRLYQTIMKGQESALSRRITELIAVVVSSANDCFY